MKKFRKKPVEIEAEQLTQDNIYEVQTRANDFMPDDKKITVAFSEESDNNWMMIGLNIPTLEGTMLCSFGDYLIRGVKGEFYPCKPDIFVMTYEPVK